MTDYPRDLIPILEEKWKGLPKRTGYPYPTLLPNEAELKALLDTAFHASFATEEGRRAGFRIIFYSPHDHEKIETKSKGFEFYVNFFRFVPLDDFRPYTAAEINRIAPAAELKRLLICVTNISKNLKKPDLRIWGMLDAGDSWWKFIHHEASGGRPAPNNLTITSWNPGELSISISGEVLMTLKNGYIFYPIRNVIWEGPVSDFLQEAKRQLHEDVMANLEKDGHITQNYHPNYGNYSYNNFVERILFCVRERQHGGSIIIIPDHITMEDTRLTDRILVKYACSYAYAWDAMVQNLADEIRLGELKSAFRSNTRRVSKTSFKEYQKLEMAKANLREALGEISQVIATLTSVDGVVIMTDKFKVRGFGAEVTALSPSLKNIIIKSGLKEIRTPIDAYGTRHRAAFRFCSSFEDAVAFVVSSDGGVKAVKRVGSDVILWPDINTGKMGL